METTNNEEVKCYIKNPKFQYLNPKQILMIQNPNSKPWPEPSRRQYDLEDRTFNFAKQVLLFVKKLPKTISTIEISKQLVRSAGSVGANYIEANECLGKKDFLMRLKISKKESKENRYWLRLINLDNGSMNKEQNMLIQEANELMKIFGSIIEKSK